MTEERRRWHHREPPAFVRESTAYVAPAIWFTGWLFTWGYASLVWWKILLALVIWPYYLGSALTS